MKKATQQETKTHNTRLILKTIYDQGAISRADLARLTHLTRTTVSDIVAELIGDGLVAETGRGSSVGGKPPILLSVVDDARHLIGLDLASHEFRGAIINLRGQIKYHQSLAIGDQNGAQALNLVYRLVDDLLPHAESRILGIGIGSPGLLDTRQGIVHRSVNLDWHNLPLRDLLQDRCHLPVYIANDCQVAALGEFTFGESKDVSNLVLIKVGHGVGAGIVLDRQLYQGDGFGAGEIGHVVVREKGEQCRCGHMGCLETVVSSRAMVKRVQALACQTPASLLHRQATGSDPIDLEAICAALAAGDGAVQSVVAETGFYLGQAVSNLIVILGIRRVVIGGSVARLGQHLIDPVLQQVKQGTLAELAEQTDISISRLGLDIVLLGAAALVLARELGI